MVRVPRLLRPVMRESESAAPVTTALLRVSSSAGGRRVAGVGAACVLAATSCAQHPTDSGRPAPVLESVQTVWYAGQTEAGYARPFVSGDRVIFGTGDGRLIARGIRFGQEVWSSRIGNDADFVDGANVVSAGGVTMVAINRRVVAVDEASGSPRWVYRPPVDDADGDPGLVTRASLDVDSASVYVPAWGSSISAVDLRTGQARWVWRLGLLPSDTAASGPFRSGTSGVKVDGDRVYAGFWHFRNDLGLLPREIGVVALDRATGRQLWLTLVPAPRSISIFGAPAVDARHVYVTGVGGETYALDRRSGAVVWGHEAPDRFTSVRGTAVVRGDTVYHDGGNGFLYALRAATGAVTWQAPYESSSTRDLLVTDRRIGFVGGGPLYVFDRATGRRIAKVEQPGASVERALISSSPAALGDTWFVTVNGGAWAFRAP